MSLRKVIAPLATVAALSAGHAQFSPEKTSATTVVFEMGALQDTPVLGSSSDQAQCDPQIDICADPYPGRSQALNVCGSLAVLRAGLEDVSDSENPLVPVSEKAGIRPPNNTELADKVSAFSRLFAKEHPEARAGKTPQDLLRLVDAESVKRTTAEITAARQNDTADVALLLGLVEQAKGAVNEATSDLCIDRQGRPKRDNQPGILAASLTCKVVSATSDTLGERIMAIDAYRFGDDFYQTASTLPPKIPYDESTTPTTTPPRDRVNPKEIPVEPAFTDLATLLNVGFVQEFPGLVTADSKDAAGIQTLLKRLQNLDKDSVDYRKLLTAYEAANDVDGGYCDSHGIILNTTPKPETSSDHPITPSTLPERIPSSSSVSEEPPVEFTTISTTPPAVTTPIAPPAVPIHQHTAVVTG